MKSGVAPTDDYGIALAELSGLPKTVTEKARKYASEQIVSITCIYYHLLSYHPYLNSYYIIIYIIQHIIIDINIIMLYLSIFDRLLNEFKQPNRIHGKKHVMPF